jgi:serine O-acetyltransferase
LKFPQIGDNVIIYSGAVILGDVNIGDNSVIGANSVVIDDVPEGVIVAGIPASIIDRK